MTARTGTRPAPMSDLEADISLVRSTTRDMGEKLARKRQQGRGGWWDEDQCTTDELRRMLLEHTTRALAGDDDQWLDVTILGAMLHARTRP